MFKGFNLELTKKDSQSFLNIDDSEDIAKYDADIQELRRNLGREIEKIELPRNPDDNSIDASQLINNWFPGYSPDVFISHSHDDERTAKRIACWLKKNFGLTTFIDSTVWGNANDLLQTIDDKYCVTKTDEKGIKTYSYSTRNFTTSHVHMMLSTALNDMIYASECIIFLNTPKSVQTTEVKNKKTNSPWIYNELKTACIVKPIYPRQGSGIIMHREKKVENSMTEEISYDVNKQLATFENLTSKKLQQWLTYYSLNKNVHPLDCLYTLNKKAHD